MIRNFLRVVCLAALLLPAAGMFAQPLRAEALDTEETSFSTRASNTVASWVLPDLPGAFESSFHTVTVETGASAVEDVPEREPLWIPILAVILAGIIFRYIQSEQFRALYDQVYGPLIDY